MAFFRVFVFTAVTVMLMSGIVLDEGGPVEALDTVFSESKTKYEILVLTTDYGSDYLPEVLISINSGFVGVMRAFSYLGFYFVEMQGNVLFLWGLWFVSLVWVLLGTGLLQYGIALVWYLKTKTSNLIG